MYLPNLSASSAAAFALASLDFLAFAASFNKKKTMHKNTALMVLKFKQLFLPLVFCCCEYTQFNKKPLYIHKAIKKNYDQAGASGRYLISDNGANGENIDARAGM